MLLFEDNDDWIINISFIIIFLVVSSSVVRIFYFTQWDSPNEYQPAFQVGYLSVHMAVVPT